MVQCNLVKMKYIIWQHVLYCTHLPKKLINNLKNAQRMRIPNLKRLKTAANGECMGSWCTVFKLTKLPPKNPMVCLNCLCY